MNYRHAYHAGNHADVFKHIVLARAVEHLKKKAKPFFALDAHAGAGVYDLTEVEATKTGEWQSGVGKLGTPLSDPRAELLLAPWRRAAGADRSRYPGSPAVIQSLLRENDRLLANELHPEDRLRLLKAFDFDSRVTLTGLDARIALKAHLPPPERRGLVLIDPPYESLNEADVTISSLKESHRRFATGTFLIWYPITGDGLSDRLLDMAKALGIPQMLNAQLEVRPPRFGNGLAGSGMLIVNPPWQLDEELGHLLPHLSERLSEFGHRGAAVSWLTQPL